VLARSSRFTLFVVVCVDISVPQPCPGPVDGMEGTHCVGQIFY
jgi:hypothetical protein